MKKLLFTIALFFVCLSAHSQTYERNPWIGTSLYPLDTASSPVIYSKSFNIRRLGSVLGFSGALSTTGTVTGATPTSSLHLTTKAYVDAAIAGGTGLWEISGDVVQLILGSDLNIKGYDILNSGSIIGSGAADGSMKLLDGATTTVAILADGISYLNGGGLTVDGFTTATTFSGHVEYIQGAHKQVGVDYTYGAGDLHYNSLTRTIEWGGTHRLFYNPLYGRVHEGTTTDSAVHADVTGVYHFYIDPTGALIFDTGEWSILEDSPIAEVYFNATQNVGVLMNERHNNIRNIDAHNILHREIGSTKGTGHAISDYTIDDYSAEASYTYSIATGIMYDEDLIHTLATLEVGGPYNIWHRLGNPDEWTVTSGTLPHLFGTNIQYNLDTAGTWSLAEMSGSSQGNYMNMWVFGIPAVEGEFQHAIIVGQASYSTESGAESALITDELTFGSVPFDEFVPLYQIVYHCRDLYAGTWGNTEIKSVTALTVTKQQITAGTAPGDHNSLAGLQGGSASERYHLTQADYDTVVAGITGGAWTTNTATGAILDYVENIDVQDQSLVNVDEIDMDVSGSAIYIEGAKISNESGNITTTAPISIAMPDGKTALFYPGVSSHITANFGVGPTVGSPLNTFHVKNSGEASAQLQSTASNSTLILDSQTGNDGSIVFEENDVDKFSIIHDASGDDSLDFTDGAELPLLTLSQEGIFEITQTTTGQAQLMIDGNDAIYIPPQDSFAGSMFLGSGGANLSHITSSNGRYNSGFGIEALKDITTGYFNSALGSESLANLTSGNKMAGIGYRALYNSDTGRDNLGIGTLSLFTTSGTNSYGNVGVGSSSFYYLGEKTNNTGVGYRAGYFLNGASNTMIGADAGGYQVGAGVAGTNYNTFIGANTGQNIEANAIQNLLLGYDIDLPIATGDYQLSIGNTIFGTGVNATGTTVDTDALIGIRNNAPEVALDLTGNMMIRGGTESPTTGEGIRLTYNTSVHTGTIQAYDFTGAAYLPLRLQGSDVRLYDEADYALLAQNDTVTLFGGTAQAIYIGSTGNVGIGALVGLPGTPLEVKGESLLDGAASVTGVFKVLDTGSSEFLSITPSSGSKIIASSANDIVIDSAEDFIISVPNGQVSIADPDETVDVYLDMRTAADAIGIKLHSNGLTQFNGGNQIKFNDLTVSTDAIEVENDLGAYDVFTAGVDSNSNGEVTIRNAAGGGSILFNGNHSATNYITGDLIVGGSSSTATAELIVEGELYVQAKAYANQHIDVSTSASKVNQEDFATTTVPFTDAFDDLQLKTYNLTHIEYNTSSSDDDEIIVDEDVSLGVIVEGLPAAIRAFIVRDTPDGRKGVSLYGMISMIIHKVQMEVKARKIIQTKLATARQRILSLEDTDKALRARIKALEDQNDVYQGYFQTINQRLNALEAN